MAADPEAARPHFEPSPLRSVHTTSLPELMKQLGISVAVTTYQAGKLVVLRANQGSVQTHFRDFNRPMGFAADGNRLAIGCANEIREFLNIPAVCTKLQPPGRHDACYMPRICHTTGDIQIHEMAWAGDDLWFVNTLFSCLCTRHAAYSFVPRWRPPFVSGLAPEDRCHLNGMCLVDGRPAFVTALGETDSTGGWRANKKNGGVLIEIDTNRILLRGLSMPHSPRWHQGKLWLLESGRGSLGFVDLQTGRYQNVVELPGFTRGLDFCGRFAFVGLSQVRESAVFSGIPIAERPLSERRCGVWVVDLTTGQIVAFVRFEDAVQEIFAVQVLVGHCFPDIINDDKQLIAGSFVLPDEALGDVQSRTLN